MEIPSTEIANSFFIKTKCNYYDFTFDVDAEIDNSLRILTDNKKAFQELRLEYRDQGVYQTIVKKERIHSIWEERSKSSDNRPYPEELPRKEFIAV